MSLWISSSIFFFYHKTPFTSGLNNISLKCLVTVWICCFCWCYSSPVIVFNISAALNQQSILVIFAVTRKLIIRLHKTEKLQLFFWHYWQWYLLNCHNNQNSCQKVFFFACLFILFATFSTGVQRVFEPKIQSGNSWQICCLCLSLFVSLCALFGCLTLEPLEIFKSIYSSLFLAYTKQFFFDYLCLIVVYLRNNLNLHLIEKKKKKEWFDCKKYCQCSKQLVKTTVWQPQWYFDKQIPEVF